MNSLVMIQENERVTIGNTLTYTCKTGFYHHGDVNVKTHAENTVLVPCLDTGEFRKKT